MRLQKCPTLVGTANVHDEARVMLCTVRFFLCTQLTLSQLAFQQKPRSRAWDPGNVPPEMESKWRNTTKCRTKFFFAYRAETVFNICQMSRPTVKTTNGRGSCQGQPAKCRTKSPGRHSWADQSLEAGGTNAFRWAWHRFEVFGPVDSDRSMRLYLHLHHITVYTVYMCVCA